MCIDDTLWSACGARGKQDLRYHLLLKPVESLLEALTWRRSQKLRDRRCPRVSVAGNPTSGGKFGDTASRAECLTGLRENESWLQDSSNLRKPSSSSG